MAAANNTNSINGAGAHFSWVIFNRLKPVLENKTGRSIQLYGKNSALGLGCDAAIKNALHYSPQQETFGFVCCALHPDEVKKNNLHVYPLAEEPILIIVNQSNPVNNLSLKQVRDIFSGRITNWSEVGGNNKPIVVITRLHCKKRPGHWKTILPDAKNFRADRLNVYGADDMVRKVTDFNDAIGHVGSTWKFTPADRLKRITIDHVQPTAENIKFRKYPFYRTLSAVTKKGVSGDVVKLIQEVQYGETFHKIASDYDLLPLNKKK
jgi:ABC-type phosphate transport system substrate-binding protein